MTLIHIIGILFLLRVGASTTIPSTSSEEPPFPDEDYELPTNYDDVNIESGIVFMNRGSVLLTGENWIVAKEFNITDVASLVNEAKHLFPAIKSRLQNSTDVEEENIWDLQFFRDSINQEIDIIEPIINKIDEKISIFENMLPRKDGEHFQSHTRKKRFIDILISVGIGFATGFGGAMFEEMGNKGEIRKLNAVYERMLILKDRQEQQARREQLEIKYISKNVNELKGEMKNLEKKLMSLRQAQRRETVALKKLTNKTIEAFLHVENEVDENSQKISKLERDMMIVKVIIDHKLNELNKTVETVKKDITEVKETAVKQYTIITDLYEKTKENRRSIYNVKRVLAKAITTWKSSQKEITEKLNMVVSVTSTMRMMEMRLLNIDTYLTGLLEALDTIATGRLSPNLVSPIQLVKILKDMEDHLPPGVYPLTLIKEDAVYEYYTYATVYALAIPGAIRVFIKLPLRKPSTMFSLYEPYSLPFYHQDAGVFIEISKPSDFIIVSADSHKVAEIKRKDLEKCKEKNKMYLCEPSFTLHEGQKCSLSLIKENEEGMINFCERSVVVPNFKSKWIRVDGGWIYSVPRMTSITLTNYDGQIQTKTISGTGFLQDVPHTFIYADDGTVLFPNDVLGDIATEAFTEGHIFVPKVPNLLLMNECSKISNSENEDIIIDLSNANTEDTETTNIYNLLNHVKLQLFAEAPENSDGALLLILAIAVIVNYIAIGFMCWGKTKKILPSEKEDNILEETSN